MVLNKLIAGLASLATVMVLISGFILSSKFPDKKSGITGRITFDDTVPRLRSVNMSTDPKCTEKHKIPVSNPMLTLGLNNGLANVFVSISNPPTGDYPVPSEPVVLEIKDCMCVPRVIAAMKGQEVRFVNSDGILHNINGLSKVNRPFNIGMPPSFKEKTMIFDKAEGMFRIKSNVHAWERAYLAIMDHPFYAVTGDDGTFEIPGLPDGTYNIIAWHERLPAMKGSVTISGQNASIDFSFKTPTKE